MEKFKENKITDTIHIITVILIIPFLVSIACYIAFNSFKLFICVLCFLFIAITLEFIASINSNLNQYTEEAIEHTILTIIKLRETKNLLK